VLGHGMSKSNPCSSNQKLSTRARGHAGGKGLLPLAAIEFKLNSMRSGALFCFPPPVLMRSLNMGALVAVNYSSEMKSK
jgi:hypothetical protein